MRRFHAVAPSWRQRGWVYAAALLLGGLTLLPLSQLAAALFNPQTEVWEHVGPLLPELVANTFCLLAGVLVATAILGTAAAWFTAVCEFPGRRFFAWALMLPLAIPAYVSGFVMVGLLDYSGPVATFWRSWCGDQAWFPAIRSGPGVTLVLSLSLYPYVYLLARNAFLTQSARAMEAGRSLGQTAIGVFFRVALPMARPWIAAGLMLVAMETLADFGAVSVFNYETFTTAIYKAWFGLFSLPTAAQLAAFLVLFALLVLWGEQHQRTRQRYFFSVRSSNELRRVPLSGWYAWLVTSYLGVLFMLAFLLPAGQLLIWSADVLARDWDERFAEYLLNTLGMATAGSAMIVAAALILAWVKRRHSDPLSRAVVRLATLGYAIPGTVLAVGIFIPVAWLDNQMIDLARAFLHLEITPILGGGIAVLLLAYLVRFAAVGFGSVDSALQRITPSMEESSVSLGVFGFSMVRRVHLPLLRGGMISAFLLVFVDIMKEMPITLLMRPFGWDTLAVRIFEMTSEGEWQRAALPATVLVLAGIFPIAWLIRATETGR